MALMEETYTLSFADQTYLQSNFDALRTVDLSNVSVRYTVNEAGRIGRVDMLSFGDLIKRIVDSHDKAAIGDAIVDIIKGSRLVGGLEDVGIDDNAQVVMSEDGRGLAMHEVQALAAGQMQTVELHAFEADAAALTLA